MGALNGSISAMLGLHPPAPQMTPIFNASALYPRPIAIKIMRNSDFKAELNLSHRRRGHIPNVAADVGKQSQAKELEV